jgi:predicted aldo/keto reductase-like oxidoreductase
MVGLSSARMDYIQVGASDLRVSRIALGCMGFGSPGQGHNPWALDDTTAAPIFRRAAELGSTFWDTANVYGHGTSAKRSACLPIRGRRRVPQTWLGHSHPAHAVNRL